jgi:hypothetical protein
MTDPYREQSVIDELRSFTWSTEDSVAYEAAVEAVNGAVGAYSALIAAEEAKQEPDLEVVEMARSGRTDCVRWREQLDPADRTAVAETRRRFSRLAEDVRSGLGH